MAVPAAAPLVDARVRVQSTVINYPCMCVRVQLSIVRVCVYVCVRVYVLTTIDYQLVD